VAPEAPQPIAEPEAPPTAEALPDTAPEAPSQEAAETMIDEQTVDTGEVLAVTAADPAADPNSAIPAAPDSGQLTLF
jgi:hypothetical protein